MFDALMFLLGSARLGGRGYLIYQDIVIRTLAAASPLSCLQLCILVIYKLALCVVVYFEELGQYKEEEGGRIFAAVAVILGADDDGI